MDAQRYNFVLTILFAVSLLMTLLALALTAASYEKGSTSCGGVSQELKIRERTLGFVVSTCVFAWLVAGFGIFTLKFRYSFEFFRILLGCVCFLELFWLVSWALFAKELDDVKGSPCDTPPVWGAGFTFTLFSWFLWTGITVVAVLLYKQELLLR
eukprot:TRINITY_DN3702_c0_g1_i1.p1 TRINITY_DN3702_c0_g1~~TRINITY_DN3702_c0_g1_i1.p1  ORF type:complete len:179 (-),score=42.77 TRINITY_DN3702_c0_g1_i1:376-840(-)